MGGIRQLIDWAFAGLGVCVCMVLAAPAGGAAGFTSELQPPPSGEPPPFAGEPLQPTLVLVPATGSAEVLVDVVGDGFVSCVAANGEVKSSNGETSLAAAGDVYFFGEGIDPIAITHLDEELRFSTNLEIVISESLDEHRLMISCVDDEGSMGAVDLIVPPLPESGEAGSVLRCRSSRRDHPESGSCGTG